MNVRKRRHVGDGDSDVDSLDEEEEEAGISFPLFKGQFSSWEEFHKKFDSYQADTHQLYKLRTTNSVKDRNKQRTAQAIRRGTTPLLFDESLQYYTKSLICTHGWSFKPRGKGDRTNHNIRSIECPAKLNAVLFQDKSGCYKVRVSSHLAVHNHDVGQDVYYSYAEARKINSPGTRNVVKTLVQGGSKKKKILRYLKDVSGKPILPKDVENLIARMRRETYTSEDDNKRVTQLLHDFSEGPGNAVNVFRDKGTGLTSCITFQTAHMRRMTRKFPEAICIDATYGTNINRYRLFSFMVTDKFGCGAFAQHALVDGESRANMACAVSAFKQNNPAWSEVKVIVIDKDFTELALLEDEFPAATVILCHFHVIDYLKRQVSKKDYGFSSFEKMHIKNLLTMMVRAENEVSFDDYLSAVKKLCASKPAFMDYFTENWLNCKDLWCTFKRGNIPHLDNNTNNRLEASWGATKQVLHRHMAMDECIDHLLFLQQSAEDQYAAKVKRVGFRYNQHYDEEMCMLAKLATHHACDLVEEQYCVSSEETYRIAADTVSPTYINISSEKSGSDFAVSVEENKCSCAFYQTLLLPCRHILFLRRQKGLRSVIPYESIPERWLLADEDEGEDVPDVAQRFFVEDIETAPDRVLGHNEKYRAGFAICQKIAEVVADKGSRSFRAWISYLTKVERAARLDDAPPSDKLGDAFTNTSELGDTLTSSSDVGKEVGEVSEEVGEEVGDAFTNLSGMDDGVGVEDTTGDVVDITSLGSPVHIAQLASTPVQRRLDLNTVDSDDTLTIQLNTASRPAGRPREKKSAKKAKRRKEFEGTKALANQLNSVGDITLERLRAYMDEKKLSLSMIEPVFAAIRPMYHSALYKRPKGHVIAPGAAKVVETSIRFVLPELLVTKAEAAGRNAAIREQSQSGRMPPHEDIVISILDVGTFSMTDIDTMKEWHSLQKKISRARALTKWIDGRQDTEERRTILCKIPKMNMYSAFKSSLGETIVQFDDLTRFAGENWLSDGCVFVGPLQLAVRMTANTHQCRGRIREIHAVDPVFLAFEDPEDCRRMVDTQRCIFSKGYESRVILSPVYINVDVPHWCGRLLTLAAKPFGSMIPRIGPTISPK